MRELRYTEHQPFVDEKKKTNSNYIKNLYSKEDPAVELIRNEETAVFSIQQPTT